MGDFAVFLMMLQASPHGFSAPLPIIGHHPSLLPLHIRIPPNCNLASRNHLAAQEPAVEICEQHTHQSLSQQIPNRLPHPLFRTNIDSLSSLLQSCRNAQDLAKGRLVHSCIVSDGVDEDKLLGNFLIQMYGKCGALEDARAVFVNLQRRNVFTWTIMIRACLDCGSLEDARSVFDEMPQRNVVSWNVMIAAYAQSGGCKEVRQLFQKMKLELPPDRITFLSVLSICNNKEALIEGEQTHALIVLNGLEWDDAVGNALLNMYGKCSSLDNARRIFDRLFERDIFSWNIMISVYVQRGQGNEALKLFPQMQLDGLMPNNVTCIVLLDACASEFAFAEGKQIHYYVVSGGFESNIVVGTALLNMYGKCDSLVDAQRTFDKMLERDIVSWNAMIEACAQHGEYTTALKLFQKMQLEGFIPDKATFLSLLSSCSADTALQEGRQLHSHIKNMGLDSNIALGNALINMYGKCGSVNEARNMFNQMHQRDLVSWNAMITAYAQNGEGVKALQLFQEMKRVGIVPDEVTIMGIIDACASQGILSDGKQVHAYIKGYGLESNPVIASALVKMYSKCGSLDDARSAFEESFVKDVILWNAMIATYARHGLGKEALQLFQQMSLGSAKPNDVTFVNVLSACSHTGLVDEGCQYFVSMTQDHGITPNLEHYNIMLDLLGRAGMITDGEDLIKNMPLQPTATSWLTLLGACRKHLNVERGKHIAEHVLQLDPENSSPYVLFSNICAATGGPEYPVGKDD